MGVVLSLLMMWNINDDFHQMSRGAIILDGSFLGLSMKAGSACSKRRSSGKSREKTIVGIVGAGELGASLVQDLRLGTDMVPVAFLMMNPEKGNANHVFRL